MVWLVFFPFMNNLVIINEWLKIAFIIIIINYHYFSFSYFNVPIYGLQSTELNLGTSLDAAISQCLCPCVILSGACEMDLVVLSIIRKKQGWKVITGFPPLQTSHSVYICWLSLWPALLGYFDEARVDTERWSCQETKASLLLSPR